MKKFLLLAISVFMLSCNSNSTTDTATAENTPSNSEAAASTTTETIPYKNVSPDEFTTLMAKPNTVVIDVRTPEETAEGMIEGATQIDYNGSDFEAKLEALDREKEYLVYCQSGGRSAKACTEMQRLGFKTVYNLEGGYNDIKQ